jgi:Fe-S cluster assembly protein SufD
MSTQITKEQSAFGWAFGQLQERLRATSAPWVVRLRESAFDRFEQLGFPTTRDEEWKYTNVAPIAKLGFEPVSEPVTADASDSFQLASFTNEESRKSQLVFVNGSYRPDLSDRSDLQQGIVALDLAEAIGDERYSNLIRKHLAREADYNEDAFTALNTAFLDSGAFLFIPKGLHVTAPVHLLFVTDPGDLVPVSFPRILVVAEEQSSVTIIESYASASDTTYWTNAVVEIVVEDNARVEHYKLQHEGNEAFHTAKTIAGLGRNSVFDSTSITLGARLSRHDIKIRLDNEGAECHVDGLYIVAGGQHTDTHSLIDHLAPHCTSRQLYKGILDGKSRAVFNGKVFVHPGAQQTDAQQTNRNLLLSNDARVDTKPQLEIFADDVKCAHGATVGQLEDEELFYLISRGLHPELARNLLTFGFAEEVIDKIKIESIKAQLGEAVLNRLHARLEVGE